MKISLSRIRNITCNIATQCPHCGHYGTFEDVQAEAAVTDGNNQPIYYFGAKRCPNAKCKGQIFFIKRANGNEIEIIYPNQSIQFDKDNIPDRVLNAFNEAIKCHSGNCFIASAIMIRKTLEEICFEREANGKNLKDRLKDLGNKILIPKELIQGMDDLRLLGNDAAHIKAQTYSEIGKEEIEISIDFTKEILKAVYQYENLLEKLRQLKEKKKESNL